MENWYKTARVEQFLIKEAGFKEDFVKALPASVISALFGILGLGMVNIDKNTVDQAARKANLNAQEYRQLEQIVQNKDVINKAHNLLNKNTKPSRYPVFDIDAPNFGLNQVVQRNQDRVNNNDQSKKEKIQSISAPIINIGKQLIDRGFKVGYHPNFSYANGFDSKGKQRIGEHSRNSYHYKNRAFDISGASAEEMGKLFDELFQRRNELGIVELIYDKKGKWFGQGNTYSTKPYGHHGNHIHVAFSKAGLISE